MYAALDTSSQKLKNVLGRTKEKAMQRGKWPGHADTRGATKLSQALAEEGSEVSEDETATA